MRWWLMRWLRLIRVASARSSRVSARAAGKPIVFDTTVRRLDWRWPVAMGLLVGLWHFVLFPPVPRIDSTFPMEGEIADREIRAPFTFQAPLLPRDVNMKRMDKVLVEPPALRRLSMPSSQGPLARYAIWREAVEVELARPERSLAERISSLALRFPEFDEENFQRILQVSEPRLLLDLMVEVLAEVCEGGVADMLPHGNFTKVLILAEGTELLQDRTRIVTQERVGERLTSMLRTRGVPSNDTVWAALLVRQFITPNLVYDPTESRLRQETVRESVPTEREFIKGERIIDQGVRVTEQESLFLNHLHDLVVARGELSVSGLGWLRLLTRVLLIGLALLLYGWIGWIHFPEVLCQKLRLLSAVALCLILFLSAAAVALSQPGLGPFAVPIPWLALLATVLFKDRVGYATSLLAVLLLGLLPEIQTASLFTWLILGGVTVVSV
ncbi:MAG: hypothetical protein ABIF77_00540, partial [bacterium]